MTRNIAIAPGVTLRAIQSDKFKTACFSVNFVRQHARSTAALDALLPSVLLRATERYPDIRSISMQLDKLYGATFGTLLRRKGEIKLLGFFADFIEDAFLPEGEAVLAQMADFLEEVLFHPLTENGCFTEAAVEGEKQNLINAIESTLNSKRAYAIVRMLEKMCEGEAYGVPRLGYAEDVRKITPQDLWAHYRRVLNEARIELFYLGGHSPEEAAKLFSRVFAQRVYVPGQVPVTQVLRCAAQCREFTETLDVTQGKLVLGLRTGLTAADEAYPALMLLNTVYGGGMSSKLFRNVREKRSLCYYADSTLERYKGLMIVSSGVAFENLETAKKAMLAELDACVRGEITQEELELARRMLLSGLRSSMDSPAQMDEFYIGMATMPSDDIPELIQKLQQVTLADLQRVAAGLTLDTVYFLKGAEA